MAEQSYRNHRRFVPLFHFVVGPILLLNLIWASYRLFRGLPGVPVFDRALDLLMALVLIAIFFFARIFALTAQDRVIRLEERLRLERLLPGDLKPRIPDLTRGQLVALRFASDDELSALARKALDERMPPDQIKREIGRWRPDDLRL